MGSNNRSVYCYICKLTYIDDSVKLKKKKSTLFVAENDEVFAMNKIKNHVQKCMQKLNVTNYSYELEAISYVNYIQEY
jgi:hypothetical protein